MPPQPQPQPKWKVGAGWPEVGTPQESGSPGWDRAGLAPDADALGGPKPIRPSILVGCPPHPEVLAANPCTAGVLKVGAKGGLSSGPESLLPHLPQYMGSTQIKINQAVSLWLPPNVCCPVALTPGSVTTPGSVSSP